MALSESLSRKSLSRNPMTATTTKPTIRDHVRSDEEEAAAIARVAEMLSSEGYTLADVFDISDRHLEAMYCRAYDLQKRGKIAEASKLLELMCTYNPYDGRAWIALGYCRERLNRLQAAVQTYIVATLMDDENPVPHLRAAECLVRMQELEAAKECATTALQLAAEKSQYEDRRARAEVLLKVIRKQEEKRKGRK